MEYKLFQVKEDYAEYIIARTPEEALQDHNSRVDEEFHATIEEVSVVAMDEVGRFETESGDYKTMTFGQFVDEMLGDDFVYERPVLLCWHE
ncbi:hypothetical protein NSQ24_01340 [Brevibacillus sp. FSL L8-0520]|uniref:hypothetical protein n=1 Tax=Brevibacillus sp. FSL L8-0520 TaxID=2954689 RepID=UPI0030CCD612